MPDSHVGAAARGVPDDERNYESHTFRLPPGLKARLKARAASTRRSLNSEVVVMLEAALAAEPAALRN